MKYLITLLMLISVQALADSETLKGARKDVQSFQKEMQVRLERLDQKIERLKKEGGTQKTRAIQELESARDEVSKRVDEAAEASRGRWAKWKRQVSESVDDLNRRVQKVLNE